MVQTNSTWEIARAINYSAAITVTRLQRRTGGASEELAGNVPGFEIALAWP